MSCGLFFHIVLTFFLLLENAIANNRLHQLLGLRLRFCLRGKYSDVFNFIFQINLVDLFGQCSQQQLNASGRTLTATYFFPRAEKKRG